LAARRGLAWVSLDSSRAARDDVRLSRLHAVHVAARGSRPATAGAPREADRTTRDFLV